MADLVIRPLHVGTVGRDKAIFTYLRNMGVRIEVPVLAWYVEGNGRRILVDTGGHDPNEVQMHAPYRREPAQDPVTALAAIGIAPAEIDTIILTHLHWDHAGGIKLFPNAKIFVRRDALSIDGRIGHSWKGHRESTINARRLLTRPVVVAVVQSHRREAGC